MNTEQRRVLDHWLDVYQCGHPQDGEQAVQDAVRVLRSEHAALVAALEGLDLTCTYDALNPCWDGRASDRPGVHWGGGEACRFCKARSALAQARKDGGA